MDQWLYSHFVDLFERGPKDVRKVLCLELVNKGFVRVLEVHLPHYAVFVYLKT